MNNKQKGNTTRLLVLSWVLKVHCFVFNSTNLFLLSNKALEIQDKWPGFFISFPLQQNFLYFSIKNCFFRNKVKHDIHMRNERNINCVLLSWWPHILLSWHCLLQSNVWNWMLFCMVYSEVETRIVPLRVDQEARTDVKGFW